MKVYNAIPFEFKPPPGMTQLWYAKPFDIKFTLWLRKRRSISLEDMLKNSIEVEMKLSATKDKGREEIERRRNEELS